MQILNPNFALNDFFEKLKNVPASLLILDYDGTLAPFQKERNKAIPYPGVREILIKLVRLQSTRVVIISGRAIQEVISLLGLSRVPEIWGSHGLERRKLNGNYRRIQLDDQTQKELKKANELIKSLKFQKISESKPGGIALHWRGLPQDDAKKIQSVVASEWSRAAPNQKVVLKEFDGGIEFRAVDIDKGRAVKTLLSEMSEDVMAAYLGDDYTDEDAFKVLKGNKVSILVREEFRETAADLWLQPPAELLEFLSKWYHCCA